MSYDYRKNDFLEWVNNSALPTETLYERETKDGQNRAYAVKWGEEISVRTNGGIAYTAKHAAPKLRAAWSAETAKATVDTLIDGWDKGDWKVEERLFPAAPDEDLL